MRPLYGAQRCHAAGRKPVDRQGTILMTARLTNISHFYIHRLLIVLALVGLMVAPVRAAAPFVIDNYAYAADSYRDTIAKIGKTLKKTAPELQQELDAAVEQGNNRTAAQVVEQLLALGP